MNGYIKKYNLAAGLLAFIGLPLLFWALGDFPRRTVLKESISVLTILAFFLMLGQFFLARSNKTILKDFKLDKVLKIHKIIGYVFVPILLVHPFLIVVPRYFESGVTPLDAFVTLITTFDSLGVVLGMVAWSLMLIIGITTLFRNKLPLSYKTWRVLHGILSIVFIALATWHATNMGRHTNISLSVLMIILSGIGVLMLLKTYILKPAAVGNIKDSLKKGLKDETIPYQPGSASLYGTGRNPREII